ncbi:MAG: hypothetical protein NTV34_21995 [Proteobacteria bacterium]|nr:hypothetical protein [Pseudomonadota bacterium]
MMIHSRWLSFSYSILACASSLIIAPPMMAMENAAKIETSQRIVPSLLADDFLKAIDVYVTRDKSIKVNEKMRIWLNGFEKRGIDRDFLKRRFAKMHSKNSSNSSSNILKSEAMAKYRDLVVQDVQTVPSFNGTVHSVTPAPRDMKSAIHAVKLDVLEDYDDANNDNVYMYFITTRDDVVWGRVTDIYKNLDEGTQVFLNAEDRGVYGPTGLKMDFPSNHVIIDFGLIESDGDDIAHLKKISNAIVDLALAALSISNPQAGVAAAQARAEVNNLLHLVIELDSDDRLVTDSLYFTPESMSEKLVDSTFFEFTKVYEKEMFWTHFKYGMTFRLIK